jgi:hypothetical protein
MKTSSIYILAGTLALGGVAILVLALRKRPEETESPIDVTPPTQNGGGGGGTRQFSCMYGNEFPLQFGSCGSNVEKWQTYLNSKRGENLAVDGKFGFLTESATKRHPAFGNFSTFNQGKVSEVDFNMATFQG